ncbi:MAG: hypothetical protein NC236_02405 [Mycoplasma sp.]|nr:hypothetical protein [Mycoplasma sp.]
MKKKFLLGLGSLSIVATVGSIAAVASCGSEETDQEKVDAITSDQVLAALKLTADNTKAPTEPTGDALKNLTINGVEGLTVAITEWNFNTTTGELTFKAAVSKEGMTTKDVDVKQTGWKSIPATEKDGYYDITGVKMNPTTSNVATKLAAMAITGIDGTDYFTSGAVNQDSSVPFLPGYTSAGLADAIPSDLGLAPGDVAADQMVVYKWAHEVTGQNSWPEGTTNPTVGTNSYTMKTTEDYGVIVKVGTELKIVAKFSMRVTE